MRPFCDLIAGPKFIEVFHEGFSFFESVKFMLVENLAIIEMPIIDRMNLNAVYD
jgi:hypothetical protein